MARRQLISALVVLGLALATPARADFVYPAEPKPVTYPETDRDWGPIELGAIEAILRAGPAEAFPRLASDATRDVFLKMVDSKGLVRASDEAVPVLRRLIDLRTLDGYLGCYRARYNVQTRQGAALQSELVRLQVYQLELSALAVRLTEPYVASLDAEERERLKQAGFFGAFATLRTHLAGTVMSLSEASIYSVADRIALAEAIGRTFPGMRRIFSRQDRRAIAADLERLSTGATDAGLARALLATAAVITGEEG